MTFFNLDIANVAALLSTIIAAIVLVTQIHTNKKSTKEREKKLTKDLLLSDYEKVVAATRKLENNREKNSGEHYHDESVYIKRAENIRISTSFFSFATTENEQRNN